MYELLNELKPVHVMHLPQEHKPDHAFAYWKGELTGLKEKPEKSFNVKIADEILGEETEERNNDR